jgi:hypothetical protein
MALAITRCREVTSKVGLAPRGLWTLNSLPDAGRCGSPLCLSYAPGDARLQPLGDRELPNSFIRLGKDISIISDASPSNSGRRPGDAVSNTKNVGVPSKRALTEALATSGRVQRYSRGSDMTRSASKSSHSRTDSYHPVSSRERSPNSRRASSPYSRLKRGGYR